MKVLITGGAGYIGSVLTEACLRSGHEVVIYDNLVRGHAEAVHPEARLVVGDVGDRELVAATLADSKAEIIVHLAGYGYVGESMADPGKYFLNNTCRPIELLEAMVATGVGKIIFSSSSAIFGEPGDGIITEDTFCNPTNPYGTSKLMFEQILDWYDTIYDIKHMSLRYFNVAGASAERGEDHEPESHLIPLIIKTAMGQRDYVEIYGTDYPTPDGTCVRDYIHIEDLAQAHLLALENLDDISVHYNLGNGQGYTVREVIKAVRTVSGRDFEVRETSRRPGDPSTLVTSSRKIEDELGWRQVYTGLDKIVASAWDWHTRYPNGYR